MIAEVPEHTQSIDSDGSLVITFLKGQKSRSDHNQTIRYLFSGLFSQQFAELRSRSLFWVPLGLQTLMQRFHPTPTFPRHHYLNFVPQLESDPVLLPCNRLELFSDKLSWSATYIPMSAHQSTKSHYYFRHSYKEGGKSSTQSERFFVTIFTNYPGRIFRFSTSNFLNTKLLNFAVECD